MKFKTLITAALFAASTSIGFSQTWQTDPSGTNFYTNPSNTKVGLGVGDADCRLHLKGANYSDAQIILERTQYHGWGGGLHFLNQKPAYDNITLGNLAWYANNGSADVIGARIKAVSEGAWSTSSYNANLEFQTTSGTTTGTKMIITHDGKVGIGRTNPQEALEVGGDIRVRGNGSDGLATMSVWEANTTNNKRVMMGASSTDAFLQFTYSTSGVPFNIKYGSHNAMTIKQANVGIGNTDPSCRLDIVGNLSSANMLIKLQQGYAIFSDNVGSGYGGDSRLWIDAPNNGSMVLGPRAGANYLNNIRVRSNLTIFHGNVGINTTSVGSHKLAVDGSIGAREIVVEAGTWSDFVFADDYTLKSLQEVENFIIENKHLPDVPSEKEVMENGISLGEMDAVLLQKIEELTLYTIEQEKTIEQQNKVLMKLMKRLEELENK